MTPIVLIALSLAMLLAAWLLARSTGVRVGAPVIGSDLGVDALPPVAMSDPQLRLRGRPDLLLRERGRGRIYPVEVKPTRDSTTLYPSDALQLAAYMMLTQNAYGRDFAGYGIVRYRVAEFRVELTPELRRRCLAAVDGVRSARRAAAVHRSHQVAAKCRGCAVREPCGEAIP